LQQDKFKKLDRQYIDIKISTLLKIKDIKVALFVELNELKFVKIFNPDSKFEITEFERYQKRGVDTLYVRAEEYNDLVGDYKKNLLSDSFIESCKMNISDSFAISTGVQEIVNKTVTIFGIDKNTERLAIENIKLVKTIADNVPDLNMLLRWILDANYQYEYIHSILICYLTALISSKYNFKSKNAMEYISLAAFFHDTAMDIYLIENENNFREAIKLGLKSNKQEIEIVKYHPIVSANLIKSWNECPDAVVAIIESHCELADGKGFPFGKSADEIDELCSCFIFCEDLTHKFLLKKNRESVLEYLKNKSAYYSKGNFKELYDVLTEILSKQVLSPQL
jgi:HD-GYP domain-containing protein (c-di-GMP phosphodiesterase class II)